MSQFKFKILKVGNILCEHDQMFDKVITKRWDELYNGYHDKSLCKGYKITAEDLRDSGFKFRRPLPETLKLIKHIKKELKEIRARADKVEEQIYRE